MPGRPPDNIRGAAAPATRGGGPQCAGLAEPGGWRSGLGTSGGVQNQLPCGDGLGRTLFRSAGALEVPGPQFFFSSSPALDAPRPRTWPSFRLVSPGGLKTSPDRTASQVDFGKTGETFGDRRQVTDLESVESVEFRVLSSLALVGDPGKSFAVTEL